MQEKNKKENKKQMKQLNSNSNKMRLRKKFEQNI